MAEITLLPLDRTAAESLAADPVAFADRHKLLLAPYEAIAVEIAVLTADMLAKTGATMPWVGYLTLEGTQRHVVGTCGFKGGPDTSGTVEIAYFTFPQEEGSGIATKMALALVQLVSEVQPELAALRAHTLPERNASCRVLEKAGFQYVGPVVDPEDGPVWRWERPLTATP